MSLQVRKGGMMDQFLATQSRSSRNSCLEGDGMGALGQS